MSHKGRYLISSMRLDSRSKGDFWNVRKRDEVAQDIDCYLVVISIISTMYV